MPRIPLMEGVKGAVRFIADPKNIIHEELEGGRTRTRIPGKFSICDCVNGNNRRYPRRVWEKNLKPGSQLMEMISRNAAFGLLEHPSDGQVTLNSPISHLVTAAELKENGEVHGEITLLAGLNEGHKLAVLIEAGYNPLVSSRGFGSLIRDSKGIDEVQDDYVCEGWDVVAKPSFVQAQLEPSRKPSGESTVPENQERIVQENEKKEKCSACGALIEGKAPYRDAEDRPVCSQACTNAKKGDRKEESLKGQPSAGAAPAAPAANQPQQRNQPMVNIQEVKSRIDVLKTSTPAKMGAREFAEGMATVADLHQQVAEYIAEDTKRSWEGQRLHKQLDELEESWEKAQKAPSEKASKLQESLNRALRVCSAVTETGLKFKAKLAEAISANIKNVALIEQLTKNGQGWMKRAKALEEQNRTLQSKLVTACKLCDSVRDISNEDLTTVSRRLLQIEFAEALKDKPELVKQLDEAKHPKQVLAVRETLSPSRAADGQAIAEGQKPGEGQKPAAGKDGKPVAEGQKPEAGKPAPAAGGGIKEGQKPPVSVFHNDRNPRSLSESIGIAKRLSERRAGVSA